MVRNTLTTEGVESLRNPAKVIEALRVSVQDLLSAYNSGTEKGFEKSKPITFPSAYYLVYLIEVILNHGLKGALSF
jgi:hypothetical protein